MKTPPTALSWTTALVILLWALTALALAPTQAQAQIPTVNNQNLSTTLTTTPVCLAADNHRRSFAIENPTGGTNNVCYCVGVGGQQCTPTCGSAGTSVLTPGNVDSWPPPPPPADPVCLVGSGSSTPVTIRSGK